MRPKKNLWCLKINERCVATENDFIALLRNEAKKEFMMSKNKYLKLTKLKKIKLTKLKNSNCDKTQIVTKLERSNCDQTQKLKLCKTKKIKLWKLKNSNCDSNKNDSSDRSSYNDIF